MNMLIPVDKSEHFLLKLKKGLRQQPFNKTTLLN